MPKVRAVMEQVYTSFPRCKQSPAYLTKAKKHKALFYSHFHAAPLVPYLPFRLKTYKVDFSFVIYFRLIIFVKNCFGEINRKVHNVTLLAPFVLSNISRSGVNFLVGFFLGVFAVYRP